MDDEVSVSVPIPLDADGFMRRECPACEQQFKWYSHEEGDPNAEGVDQYFCPLCGESSGPDSWWTQEQLEYAEGVAAPEIERMLQDTLDDAFKGLKGVTFNANGAFSLDVPAPVPLLEPNDMVIVESPCHPNEPVKVPHQALLQLHCLVCGQAFAV